MPQSWGLTMPPKLVHREPQDSCLWSLRSRSSDRHAERDTHCTHMHRDTPVRVGQGLREDDGADGRGEGGGHATAVSFRVGRS